MLSRFPFKLLLGFYEISTYLKTCAKVYSNYISCISVLLFSIASDVFLQEFSRVDRVSYIGTRITFSSIYIRCYTYSVH